MAGEPEPEPELEGAAPPLSKKELKKAEKERKKAEKQAAKEAKKAEKAAKKAAKNGEPAPEPEPEPEEHEHDSGNDSGDSDDDHDDDAVSAASITSESEDESEEYSEEEDAEEDAEEEDDDEPEEEEEDDEDPKEKRIRVDGRKVLEHVEGRGNAVAIELVLHEISRDPEIADPIETQRGVANYVAEPGDDPPLHRAAKGKHAQVCASLLMYGADIDLVAGSGFSPLQLACLPPYEPNSSSRWDVAPTVNSIDLPVEFCARTILDHGADVNEVNWQGLTAIQLVIKALIEHSKEEQEELMVQLREERAARAEQAIIERQKAEEEAQRQRVEEEKQKKAAFELEVQRSMSGGADLPEPEPEPEPEPVPEPEPEPEPQLQLAQVSGSDEGSELMQKKARVTCKDFGECVLDIVRCLLNHKVKMDVEDTDYNTLLHLAAETGDAYGPSLIRMLKRYNTPTSRRNKKGFTAFDLAVSRDHAACALALKPEEEKLSVLEQMERAKGYDEQPPTEYQVLDMSPFMKALGDILYCSQEGQWPHDYRNILRAEQPQRDGEELPEEPPARFHFSDKSIDDKKRAFEAPFEVTDRNALAALCTMASPRLRRKPPSAEEAGGGAAAAGQGGAHAEAEAEPATEFLIEGHPHKNCNGKYRKYSQRKGWLVLRNNDGMYCYRCEARDQWVLSEDLTYANGDLTPPYTDPFVDPTDGELKSPDDNQHCWAYLVTRPADAEDRKLPLGAHVWRYRDGSLLGGKEPYVSDKLTMTPMNWIANMLELVRANVPLAALLARQTTDKLTRCGCRCASTRR